MTGSTPAFTVIDMYALSAVLLMTLSLSTPALAREAEDVRISAAMGALARKAQWSGVERRYQELTEPSAADHLLGAHSARQRGDLALVLARLDAAIAAGETEEAPDWRSDLVARSRDVHVVGKRLTAVPAPFTPDAISALELANQSLAQHGEFRGRLYLSDYEVDGHPLTLSAGQGPMSLRAPPRPEPGPLAATPPTEVKAPEPPRVPSASKRSRPGRAVLLGAAGGLLATSAGLYATGASRRGLWASADDLRDVRALRTETNRFTTLSGVTLGVAVGVGTLGVSLPAKGEP